MLPGHHPRITEIIRADDVVTITGDGLSLIQPAGTKSHVIPGYEDPRLIGVAVTEVHPLRKRQTRPAEDLRARLRPQFRLDILPWPRHRVDAHQAAGGSRARHEPAHVGSTHRRNDDRRSAGRGWRHHLSEVIGLREPYRFEM